MLGRAQVLCATLSALGTPPLSGMRFPLALVDEATQAIEPLTLLAFLRADRVLLAGDHRQLPPTVLSEEAVKGGLGRSLFERLVDTHGPTVHRMLAEQYRMNDALLSLISAPFYAGRLRAHPSVARRTLAEVLRPGADVDAPPFLFLDTAGKGFEEAQEARSESYDNPGEAALVAARARTLLDAGLPPEALAVITPYRGQASVLQSALAGTGVEVDTVDAFQGREADAVLVSCVRSNPDGRLGFLQDLRRMNVALSRARRHLFLVGDSATLGHHPFYAQLVAQAQATGGYRSAWEWPRPPLFLPSRGDPLQFLHSKGLRGCWPRSASSANFLGARPFSGMSSAYAEGALRRRLLAMASAPAVIRQEEDVWVLRIEQPNGRVQEYRCLSELQAKQLAAMLLTPREQPSP